MKRINPQISDEMFDKIEELSKEFNMKRPDFLRYVLYRLNISKNGELL
ncbi:MAG: hypothetical protein FWH29_10310 [Methanobrevibacter sp.]|nr:hypothetical protein [Methanobrevibacter sp.]